MIMFWWWAYRFVSRVSDRTVGLYLFLVGYSITLSTTLDFFDAFLKGGIDYIYPAAPLAVWSARPILSGAPPAATWLLFR